MVSLSIVQDYITKVNIYPVDYKVLDKRCLDEISKGVLWFIKQKFSKLT